MKNSKGAILVVDDEAQVRETVRALLQRAGFFVATAEDGEQAIGMSKRRDFDAIVLDLRMPGMSGMDVLRALKQCHYPSEIIILTGYGTVSSAVDALKLGALDYLIKPGAIHELPQKAQQAVELRRRKQMGMIGGAIQHLASVHHLTPKQAEVCRNLIAGRSNAEIAQEMGITEHTVKTHLKHVFERLDVESRTELAAKVLEAIGQEA